MSERLSDLERIASSPVPVRCIEKIADVRRNIASFEPAVAKHWYKPTLALMTFPVLSSCLN